jgi:hypothetical protein
VLLAVLTNMLLNKTKNKCANCMPSQKPIKKTRQTTTSTCHGHTLETSPKPTAKVLGWMSIAVMSGRESGATNPTQSWATTAQARSQDNQSGQAIATTRLCAQVSPLEIATLNIKSLMPGVSRAPLFRYGPLRNPSRNNLEDSTGGVGQQ